MEKLILVFVVTLSSIQTSFFSFENQKIYPQNAHIAGGVITMEDMILKVVLDDPSDVIEGVSIYSSSGELINQKNGCYEQNCTYSVAGMQAGAYEAQVSVQNGSNFSGHFSIQ
ncbi:MAG: hypothetical protein ACRBFS_14030 [Aureispira sp.]